MLDDSSFSITITNTCEKLGTAALGVGVGVAVGIGVGVGVGVGFAVGVGVGAGVGPTRWCFCQPGLDSWPCASAVNVMRALAVRTVATITVAASVLFMPPPYG